MVKRSVSWIIMGRTAIAEREKKVDSKEKCCEMRGEKEKI